MMLFLILNIVVTVNIFDGVLATACCDSNSVKCLAHCDCSIKNGTPNSDIYFAAECVMVNYEAHEILKELSTQVVNLRIILPNLNSSINSQYNDDEYEILNIKGINRLDDLRNVTILPKDKRSRVW